MVDNRDFFETYFGARIPCKYLYNGLPLQDLLGPLMVEGSCGAYTLYTRTHCPDGRLKATLNLRKYKTAVEWWMVFEAEGEYDTGIVSDFSCADMALETKLVDMAEQTAYPCVHYSNGSRAAADDFMPMQKSFWPFPKDAYQFSCDGGRSSSGCMPYFNLQLEEQKGIIFAIGWSGQWYVSLHRKDYGRKTNICFDARMDGTHFRLRPGEKLTMPRMLAFPWEGTLTDSFNAFRAFMLEQAPRKGEKTVCAPMSMNAWGGMDSKWHIRNIDTIRAKQIPVDVYWIDAGWYGAGYETSEDDFKDNWYANVGAWEPLPALYPKGFCDIAQAAENAGMGLLVWFEMERAVSRMDIVKEHREYFIGPRLPFTENANHETNSTPYSMMLNLGYQPARRWITEILAKRIIEARLKVLRIDFNYLPLPYWQYADAPDRQGIAEIKYMEGLYAMLDELRERFPNLVIDNCASGGRRLDYEFCRRAIPLFRTDYLCAPDRRAAAVQLHFYGLSRWLPIHGAVAGNESVHRFDTCFFRSHLGASVGVDIPETGFEPNETQAQWYRDMFSQARRMRDLMQKDFYPLTGCSLSEKDWFAYQMNDPENGNGVVVAFRRQESPVLCADFELSGICAQADYLVEDVDSGKTWKCEGRRLTKGLRVDITQKGKSRMLFYKKV